MTAFTKEQLIARAQKRKELVGMFPDSELAQMDLVLAEIALATLNAEPVADVVTWEHPTEVRRCDIRMRRHDIEPGALYRLTQAEKLAGIAAAKGNHGEALEIMGRK
ncbi:hypothetical protein MKW06_001712 [Escherichia coli]|nr:hypothetical protein [Escherichia coli]